MCHVEAIHGLSAPGLAANGHSANPNRLNRRSYFNAQSHWANPKVAQTIKNAFIDHNRARKFITRDFYKEEY